ncbi:hypothetical protein HYV12_00100 [Candidatus Dojkabacteria bacterium]|nr:hypothetical protein [Candidatus Dojkabacteria bacterium]
MPSRDDLLDNYSGAKSVDIATSEALPLEITRLLDTHQKSIPYLNRYAPSTSVDENEPIVYEDKSTDPLYFAALPYDQVNEESSVDIRGYSNFTVSLGKVDQIEKAWNKLDEAFESGKLLLDWMLSGKPEVLLLEIPVKKTVERFYLFMVPRRDFETRELIDRLMRVQEENSYTITLNRINY